MNKVQPLSTKHLIIFKIVAILFWIGLPGSFLWSSIVGTTSLFFGIMMAGTYGILSFRQVKKIMLLKPIAYDEQNLYVKLNGYSQEIPFYEIKGINLKDISGIHCIELDSTHGKRKIYFKSSLWYPFNFKKVDNEINKLAEKIIQKQRSYHNTQNLLENKKRKPFLK